MSFFDNFLGKWSGPFTRKHAPVDFSTGETLFKFVLSEKHHDEGEVGLRGTECYEKKSPTTQPCSSNPTT